MPIVYRTFSRTLTRKRKINCTNETNITIRINVIFPFLAIETTHGNNLTVRQFRRKERIHLPSKIIPHEQFVIRQFLSDGQLTLYTRIDIVEASPLQLESNRIVRKNERTIILINYLKQETRRTLSREFANPRGARGVQ